jgi:hypothetical protein
VFRRHKYSADDLLNSNHLEKIDSICGKIKDDLNQWNAAGHLPLRVQDVYNENAQEVRERVAAITAMVRERELTLWERVDGFFRRLYEAVTRCLPLFIREFLTFNKRLSIGQAA